MTPTPPPPLPCPGAQRRPSHSTRLPRLQGRSGPSLGPAALGRPLSWLPQPSQGEGAAGSWRGSLVRGAGGLQEAPAHARPPTRSSNLRTLLPEQSRGCTQEHSALNLPPTPSHPRKSQILCSTGLQGWTSALIASSGDSQVDIQWFTRLNKPQP